mmetsp:Transcript_12369/g.44487  ORF Transcript_12369/g.44487 Transcript_12369/m.44487 type:complete len:103 (-) Transcript_12369:107-415(-)
MVFQHGGRSDRDETSRRPSSSDLRSSIHSSGVRTETSPPRRARRRVLTPECLPARRRRRPAVVRLLQLALAPSTRILRLSDSSHLRTGARGALASRARWSSA